MPDSFLITETNLNDKIGGGGSLTSGFTPDLDHDGPWVLFPRVATEHDASPYATISVAELRDIVARYDAGELEALAPDDELPARQEQRRLLTREETGLDPVEPTPFVSLTE